MKHLIMVIMLILLSACGESSNEPQETNVFHKKVFVEHKKNYYFSAGQHTICMENNNRCFKVATIPKSREGKFEFVAHMEMDNFYLNSIDGDIIVPLIEN